ncbi:MAG: 16S rRNA (adenine(1518)-N(6)/adenine(1519)-N(6))-dimethyltransferase RsmA [Acidimicrobiales bacterium]
MRPPGRAEVVAVLDDHGLRPSRALGQNFLTDPNVAERIARLAAVRAGDRVVEIGAGLGSLTVALARTGARVVAIELDRRLLPALSERVVPLGVEIIHADAMELDWQAVLGAESWALVANLPYNIATPLIIDLLSGSPQIERMLVMVQREAGERLAATPGSPAYGAVSVRVAYFAMARIAGRIPSSVFIPRPNVESVLIEITRRSEPAVSEQVSSYGEINRLLTAAFSVRRKMLRRSLRGAVSEGEFIKAGIDPARRPEELAIEEWGVLAGVLRDRVLPGTGGEPES